MKKQKPTLEGLDKENPGIKVLHKSPALRISWKFEGQEEHQCDRG